MDEGGRTPNSRRGRAEKTEYPPGMRWQGLVVCVMAVACYAPAADAGQRSAAQVLAFKRANPCPSTGARRGNCPGYVVDHVWPLCAGGADDPSNMQWQDQRAAREKDRWESRLCRDLRRGVPTPG